MLTVIGGDYGENTGAVLNTTWGGKLTDLVIADGFFTSHKIPAAHIESVDIVTDENKASLLGAIGGGAVGTLIAGPIGLLAGAVLGGRKSATTMLIQVRGGKQILALGEPRDAQILMAAALATTGKERARQQQLDRIEQARQTAATPDCSVDRSHGTVRWQCDYCDARLKAPTQRAGETLPCPRCGMDVQVPFPFSE